MAKANAYHIAQGHARFSYGRHDNKCLHIIAYSSDSKVDPSTYNPKEVNEELTPVYALLFDSVDHFENYVIAMQRLLENAKQKQKNQ